MSVNLSIKDVPDTVAERLRQRAERHHRSLQGELMAIIEQAAITDPAAAADRTRSMPGENAMHHGWKTVEDLMAERRARPLASTAGLPLAVDIVRADRDSH